MSRLHREVVVFSPTKSEYLTYEVVSATPYSIVDNIKYVLVGFPVLNLITKQMA
jgi:hypothetical protein